MGIQCVILFLYNIKCALSSFYMNDKITTYSQANEELSYIMSYTIKSTYSICMKHDHYQAKL